MKSLLSFYNQSFYISEYYNLFEKKVDYNQEDEGTLQKIDKCSLYMICKRNKVSMSINEKHPNENFQVFCEISEDSGFEGVNVYNLTFDLSNFLRKYNAPKSQFSCSTSYPYNKIIIKDLKTGGVLNIPFSSLVNKDTNSKYQFLFDLEVCYVGKSYSKTQTIVDRVKAHEVVNKVTASIQKDFNNQEIIVILMDPKKCDDMPIFENGKDNIEIKKQKHIIKSIKSKIKKVDVILSSEAMLINYFKPFYNTHFKNNLLTNNLKTFQLFREIGISSLAFELKFHKVSQRLFSSHILKKKSVHVMIYDLDSSDNDTVFRSTFVE